MGGIAGLREDNSIFRNLERNRHDFAIIDGTATNDSNLLSFNRFFPFSKS